MVKVNLGCGNNVLKGWDNYDLYPISNDVKLLNLNVIPLPFKDDSIEEILIDNVFERLDVNTFELIKELHRILKKNGLLTIVVPICSFKIVHTIGFFPRHYFNVLCTSAGCNNGYKDGKLFRLVSVSVDPNNFFTRLANRFHVLEHLFPFMLSGRYIYRLEKN